jgi:hypothetical protein
MAKQIYAKPCVRCGLCCKTEICDPGMHLLNIMSPPCPALEKRNGIYCCGLIDNTAKYVYPGALSEELYSKIRQHLIEISEFGVGCDNKLLNPDFETRPE